MWLSQKTAIGRIQPFATEQNGTPS